MNARQQRLTSQGLCGVCGKRPLKTALRCEECNERRLEGQRVNKRHPAERSDVRLLIDSEIKGLLRPLTADEKEALRKQLKAKRHKIVLIAWEQPKGPPVLIDGHNRKEICDEERIPYEVELMQFGNKSQALQWVIDYQLSRRNLTPAERSYLRGMDYIQTKQPQGGDHKSEGSKGHCDPLIGNTAETIGEKHNVSPKTVKRDAEFAEAVNKLAESDPEAKEAALNGEMTKKETIAAAKPCANGTTAEPEEDNGEDSDGVYRDDWGIPIQPHAEDAFKAQEKFDELLSLLRKADRLYSDIAEMPGGAYLIRPGISINARDRWKHKGIKTALMNIADCRPTYTVCPRAYHAQAFPDSNFVHDEDCPLCHGLNWSRPLRKEEVQEEVIQVVKGAFGCLS